MYYYYYYYYYEVVGLYENGSKIFRTDAVKIIKLTTRPIGRRHPRSRSLTHVDAGPTVSFIFGTLPGSHFLSVSSILCDLMPMQWHQTGILSASISFMGIGKSHRLPNQECTVCWGWQPFCISPETAEWGRKCETGRCHGEAVRSVLAKVRGDVFARFHSVAAKCRSRNRN
jgi:hypothetical protein